MSQRLQSILLCLQQYNIRILYKWGPQLFIADWLTRYNPDEDKDEKIPGMNLYINAIETCTDILECMRVEEIRHAMQEIVTA